MSTGKRLAKRSILGTRVCAPLEDGRYYPGVIQATKIDADDRENIYCVLFEDNSTHEYKGNEIIGPGFKNVMGIKLKKEQKVFVTYNGREVTGTVINHFPHLDEVSLTVHPSSHNHHVTQEVELKKRLEEVRLMESRKSARLQDLDTDYSRLADGQTEPRRRASSFSIDVPSASMSGRKRRPSSDDNNVMDDCMAAMVLMRLSCSPKSPRFPDVCDPPLAPAHLFSSSTTEDTSACSHSWASSSSSSGVWSWSTRSPPRTATPSPPGHMVSSDGVDTSKSCITSTIHDEVIEMDETVGFMEDVLPGKKKISTKIVFQCTWPGCGMQYLLCEDVERHVRIQHLGRSEASDSDQSDHEEEFYYTEIEVEVENNHQVQLSSLSDESSVTMATIYTSSAPTLSHMDMVRPPHEDPEYKQQLSISTSCGRNSTACPINIPQLHCSITWQPHAYAASAPNAMVSPQKFIKLSPKSLSSSPKGSPLHRKGRSESRKCRKVYGMENRDLWCTQCKWKKACSRFVD